MTRQLRLLGVVYVIFPANFQWIPFCSEFSNGGCLMRTTLLLASLSLIVGCAAGRGDGHLLNAPGQPIPPEDGGPSTGPPVTPNCVQNNPPMNGDQDGDGYTPA